MENDTSDILVWRPLCSKESPNLAGILPIDSSSTNNPTESNIVSYTQVSPPNENIVYAGSDLVNLVRRSNLRFPLTENKNIVKQAIHLIYGPHASPEELRFRLIFSTLINDTLYILHVSEMENRLNPNVTFAGYTGRRTFLSLFSVGGRNRVQFQEQRELDCKSGGISASTLDATFYEATSATVINRPSFGQMNTVPSDYVLYITFIKKRDVTNPVLDRDQRSDTLLCSVPVTYVSRNRNRIKAWILNSYLWRWLLRVSLYFFTPAPAAWHEDFTRQVQV